MEDGGVVVYLVDRDGGVDHMRLKGPLVDDRLNGLVDMVMNVLADERSSGGARLLTVNADDLGLVLGGFVCYDSVDIGWITMLESSKSGS